ncbi:MAG: hypothetical protein II670_11020, partial [Alphaproteobacteria bacterium]|nr:hypothetical protein [Alphaproteobacteria bacterium]
MLSKKYLFGLLCLANTIAIFTSTVSDVIAKESIHDFRSELNQLYWDRCCCRIEYFLPNNEREEEHSWILDDYYKESRTKVIGKAIGDCVAAKGYFEHKEAADIITFENTLPELYERKNWNAVILYNYVHEAINRDDLPEGLYEYYKYASSVKEVLKNKLKLIKTCYENYYRGHIKNGDADKLIDSLQGNLDDAVNDIQKYVDALSLYEDLYEFRTNKQQYKNTSSILYIAPKVNVSSDDDGRAFKYDASFFLDAGSDQRQKYVPTFRYYDGKLYITSIKIFEETWRQTAKDGSGC